MSTQVVDDPELLRLMMRDLRTAPGIYRPTNYWQVYEHQVLTELDGLGLHDFRRRHRSSLTPFGGTDLSLRFGVNLSRFGALTGPIRSRIPLWPQVLHGLSSVINRYAPIVTPSGVPSQSLEMLAYEFSRLKGKEMGALPLEQVEVSLAGNPEGYVEVDGRPYTTAFLANYLRYVYCQTYLNFDGKEVIVELGPGAGGLVEVLKKLYPDLCFLLFDIPPQTYVSERYLSTVFPDSVVSYRQTREMNAIENVERGRIYIFGNWKMPLVGDLSTDLFINAASFQEMEPEVVANYLKHVNRSANCAYLMQMMDGKPIAPIRGVTGVAKPTTLANYKEGLSEFVLSDLSPYWTPVGVHPGYSNSFWHRRRAGDSHTPNGR